MTQPTTPPSIEQTSSVIENDRVRNNREVIVKKIDKNDLLAGVREKIADIRALFKGYTKASNSRFIVYITDESSE